MDGRTDEEVLWGEKERVAEFVDLLLKHLPNLI
jgi:hypothetical protein